ncbi:hypothetical protein DdX_22452 [Ditylenchus destructor]|uniref:Uncharacterized protein n=1 Tax=Ditylenchus destructor TaxID=166010 RepID=A0AAD4QUP2_9BILA|nr:hypothetical protein DdX_22452 [Ditylenchus destructor]
MLLDRDQLLLADKAVPAAERLGVVRGIGVIGRHIAAHDACGVFGDVEAGREPVLQPHPRDRFSIDAVPAAILGGDGRIGPGDFVLIGHWTPRSI